MIVVAVASSVGVAGVAAACPIPSARGAYVEGVLPPRPTIYFEIDGRQDWAGGDVMVDVDGVAVPARGEPIRVGDDLLYAVEIAAEEGEVVAEMSGYSDMFVGTIGATAPRPRSEVQVDGIDGGRGSVGVVLSGQGVGYWEIATPACGTSAELAKYTARGAEARWLLTPACASGGAVEVTAHYVDGSSERLAVPAMPWARRAGDEVARERAGREASGGARWLGLAAAVGVALGVAARVRRRGRALVP